MCKLIYGLGPQFLLVSCPLATDQQVTAIRDRLLDKYAERLLNTTLRRLRELGYSFIDPAAGVCEYWLEQFFVDVLEGLINAYKPNEGEFLNYVIPCLNNFLLEYPKKFPERAAKLQIPRPTLTTKDGTLIERDLVDVAANPLQMVLVIEELDERRRQEEIEVAARQIARQKIREDFSRHVNELKEPERTAYFLNKVMDPHLSYEETRQELSRHLGYDVPIGSVKGWINRAQNILAKIVHGGDPGDARGLRRAKSDRQAKGSLLADSPSDTPPPGPSPTRRTRARNGSVPSKAPSPYQEHGEGTPGSGNQPD